MLALFGLLHLSAAVDLYSISTESLKGISKDAKTGLSPVRLFIYLGDVLSLFYVCTSRVSSQV
jgi:hypothetical protein